MRDFISDPAQRCRAKSFGRRRFLTVRPARIKLLVATSLAPVLFAVPAHATRAIAYNQVSPAAAPDASHVWTNADIAKLATQDNISLVGPEPAGSPYHPAPWYYSKEKDAAWYALRAARLHWELELRKRELRQYVAAIDAARSLQTTQPGQLGLNFEIGDWGITPEAGREKLESRVHEIEAKIEDLADLAQRNGIPTNIVLRD